MIITVVLGVTAEYPSILKLYPYNSRHSLYIIQNEKPVPKLDFVALFVKFKKMSKLNSAGFNQYPDLCSNVFIKT